MRKYFTLFLALSLCVSASAHKWPQKNTPYSLLSTIRTWGFIGDSLCSGEFESVDEEGVTHYNDMYEYSWGAYICRMCGVEGYCYSRGGQTARGWIADTTSVRGWGECRKSPKQGYIVALGGNEFYQKQPVGDPSTDINLDDYNENADTFAGNLAGIVQRLKSIQPRARIFLVTQPKSQKQRRKAINALNDVTRKVAAMFDNVYLIDLWKDSPVQDEKFNEVYWNGHMTSMGYLFTAQMISDAVDKIMRENYKEFKDVGFIGTDLYYKRK